jgi:hypothetical protein
MAAEPTDYRLRFDHLGAHRAFLHILRYVARSCEVKLSKAAPAIYGVKIGKACNNQDGKQPENEAQGRPAYGISALVGGDDGGNHSAEQPPKKE